MAEESGWVSFDPGGANEHLSPETRERVMSAHRARQARRGQRTARVIVDVYENGEAVPQVQIAPGASEGVGPETVKSLVDQAAAALGRWR